MPRILSRSLALVLFVAVLAAPAAFAQDAPPMPAPEIVTDFDDAELDAFATAYIDIEGLQVQYQQQYGEVEDPEEIAQVQERFQADAGNLIDEAGITVERYEQIMIAAQTDPEVAQEVIERVERLRAEAG